MSIWLHKKSSNQKIPGLGLTAGVKEGQAGEHAVLRERSFSGIAIHIHTGLPSSPDQSKTSFLYDREKKGRMSSQLRFYALSFCHFRLFSIAFL